MVNAAGVGADLVAAMAGEPGFTTIPSRGEYYLLDKSQGYVVNHVVFQCPNRDGKGVLVSPTVHYNLIVGPNAEPSGREDVSTQADALAFVREKAVKSVPGVKNMLFGGEGIFNTVITGPGRVWLQTMPISNVAGALRPYIPTGA